MANAAKHLGGLPAAGATWHLISKGNNSQWDFIPAVLALKHPNGAELSDNQIAEHCGVSDRMVAGIRKKIKPTTKLSESSSATSSPRPRKVATGADQYGEHRQRKAHYRLSRHRHVGIFQEQPRGVAGLDRRRRRRPGGFSLLGLLQERGEVRLRPASVRTHNPWSSRGVLSNPCQNHLVAIIERREFHHRIIGQPSILPKHRTKHVQQYGGVLDFHRAWMNDLFEQFKEQK